MNPFDPAPQTLVVLRAFLALAAAVLLAPHAHAGTVTTVGKAPTKYVEDGSPITAPISYRLEGAAEGFSLIEVAKADAPSFKILNVAAGRWCNRMVAIVDGVDSDPSETVCVTVPGPNQPPVKKKPNPPYGITTSATP